MEVRLGVELALRLRGGDLCDFFVCWCWLGCWG